MSRGFFGGGGGGGTIIIGGGNQRTAPTATAFKQGRVWYTDFSNTVITNAAFDISGFTSDTDGGTPVMRLSAGGTRGYITTKAADLKDVDVRIRWRAQASSSFNRWDIFLTTLARYINDDNQVYGTQFLSDALATVEARATTAGQEFTLSHATGAINHTDTSSWRYSRIRVVGDTTWVKHWLDGQTEPEWMLIGRFRVDNNSGNDNVEFGKAGVATIYGGNISEIQITELLRADDNLIINGGLREGIATTPFNRLYPVYWDKAGHNAQNTATVESGVDPFGVTRPLFKLSKTATGSLDWVYWFYSANHYGVNAFQTRKSRHPKVVLPKALEVAIWTKGDIAFTLGPGSLGAAAVCYYNDKESTILNQISGNYYSTLGPNAGTEGMSDKKGDGTWDWTLTTFRLPILNERAVLGRLNIGIHDDTATGTLYFIDPVMRPIS